VTDKGLARDNPVVCATTCAEAARFAADLIPSRQDEAKV